ncbi:MAG: hypothetical protein ACI3XG_00380 [Faecousia sp.]
MTDTFYGIPTSLLPREFDVNDIPIDWSSSNQSQMPCAGGYFSQHIHVILMNQKNHDTGGKNMCKIRSIKQAADYFKQLDPDTQITEYTLRKLIADGTIPSIKTGNKHLVNLDQVLSLFSSANVSPF